MSFAMPKLLAHFSARMCDHCIVLAFIPHLSQCRNLASSGCVLKASWHYRAKFWYCAQYSMHTIIPKSNATQVNASCLQCCAETQAYDACMSWQGQLAYHMVSTSHCPMLCLHCLSASTADALHNVYQVQKSTRQHKPCLRPQNPLTPLQMLLPLRLLRQHLIQLLQKRHLRLLLLLLHQQWEMQL